METSVSTLTTTIDMMKKHIVKITEVIKELEKKVKESKKALKKNPKKEAKPDKAPPVKGKATDEASAEEKDEDGDEKPEEDDVEDEKPEAVGGGNEKVDKELDQAEEETGATTTQLDSLTKTIVSTEKKSEASDKVTTTEVTDTSKEDGELTEIRKKKKRLSRKRER